ncbi:MFS general substrate transporter [Epithele typhae]|uniref:MFS general substrate transporter n=1 Tax=Epithele typhae TaxID=378194 RepID=UPI002007A3FF|nr:MFS general substrate transporter [Epithele typhae]KAH9941701.1 MFS general substrate transporter [Epithele typhae]
MNEKDSPSEQEVTPTPQPDREAVTRDEKATPAEEKHLVRRLDMRIMPFICCLFLCSYLDRVNLGNARLQGLPQDILGGDPTGVLFDWANSAFYFSFVLCPVPLTVLSKLCPPRIWFCLVAVGWGVSAVLMATSFNFAGLFVSRLAIGAFEGGFSPTVPLYLSFFYTPREQGLRLAVYTAFAGVAGAFGGLLAFGIQHAHIAIENWRLLFIVEGTPSIVLGLLALFFLPDRPEQTSYLNERERQVALERANRGTSADAGQVINRSHVYGALTDWKVYAGGLQFLAAAASFSSIAAFLPTIITTFGYTNALAQLLTVPPYAVGSIVLCLVSYASDRSQLRGPFVIATSSLSGIGYILLVTVADNKHVRYFATFCITSGTYSMGSILFAWYCHNLGSESKKAAGTALYMAIGQCGAVLGSHLYPLTQGPRYLKGFGVNCALHFFSAAVAAVLMVYYHLENRRRDEKYGKPVCDAMVNTRELADKVSARRVADGMSSLVSQAPAFRYTP